LRIDCNTGFPSIEGVPHRYGTPAPILFVVTLSISSVGTKKDFGIGSLRKAAFFAKKMEQSAGCGVET
jgi:hypothetical protein